jgi:hypothetical protein
MHSTFDEGVCHHPTCNEPDLSGFESGACFMTSDQIVVVTYHCVTCGEIVSQEEDLAVPTCCGKPMTQAVKETFSAAAASTPAAGNDAGAHSKS